MNEIRTNRTAVSALYLLTSAPHNIKTNGGGMERGSPLENKYSRQTISGKTFRFSTFRVPMFRLIMSMLLLRVLEVFSHQVFF